MMKIKHLTQAFRVKLYLLVMCDSSYTYYAECNNSECGWMGISSDCVNLGKIEMLCPQCNETTEPSDIDPF